MRWMKDVFPVMPPSLKEAIPTAKFPQLVQAYMDIFATAPLNTLCGCMVAQLFEKKLKEIKARLMSTEIA